MTELYQHQRDGVVFLAQHASAMLADEMGTGKTRQALCAALKLYRDRKIDRVLVLCPAAVKISWYEELLKLDGEPIINCAYDTKRQEVYGTGREEYLAVLGLSYALLPQKRHVEALTKWCKNGKTLLICDESSFLKNRSAKQTKGSAKIASVCRYRWLLTGTPVANSPLDLYAQHIVMTNGSRGPLSEFRNFYHFRSRYAVTQTMKFGGRSFQQVTGYQNLDELNRKFAPFVLRREKKDCLDLPKKSYTVREIALTDATWRIYQELKREAMLCLPEAEERPEPNAAVRLLRLCQLTSGHVGLNDVQGTDPRSVDFPVTTCDEQIYQNRFAKVEDISSEKLSWLCAALLDGELSSEQAVIVWCRWRRERERLQQMLATKIDVYGIFGGQQEKNRSFNVQSFQASTNRRVLVAQQHAGGYGLTLTAASTAVYLSNTFSYTDRIQSEDRLHRVGQKNPCLYIDALTVGPKGQRTVDAYVLEALRGKQDLAAMTCSAWRRALAD